MVLLCLVSVFAGLLFLRQAACTCNGPRTVSELAEILYGPASGYDKLTQPGAAAAAAAARAGDEAAEAPMDLYYTNMQFMGILDVDQKLQTFTIDVWTRELWFDWRLRFNSTNLSSCLKVGRDIATKALPKTKWIFWPLKELESNIWTLKLEFQTLVEQPDVIWTRSWIISSGGVWVVKRQVLKFSCKMDFTHMPFDVQHCKVPVQPNLIDHIRLVPGMMDDRPLTLTTQENVYVGGVVDWKLDQQLSTVSSVCADIGTADLQCAKFLQYTLVLERSPSYYVKYSLMPMFFCVAMAWGSFFIARAAAPARVAVTAIAFLTLFGRVNGLLAQLPPLVGDVWLLDVMKVSMYFCLYANLEYCLANFLMRVEARIEKLRTAVLKKEKDEEQGLETMLPVPMDESHWRPTVAPYGMTPRPGERASAALRGQVAAPASSHSPTPSSSKTSPPETSQLHADSASAAPNTEALKNHICIDTHLHKLHASSVKQDPLKRKICKLAGPCDRCFVTTSGRIIFRDQHVDVCSRYLFPIAYTFAVAFFFLNK